MNALSFGSFGLFKQICQSFLVNGEDVAKMNDSPLFLLVISFFIAMNSI